MSCNYYFLKGLPGTKGVHSGFILKANDNAGAWCPPLERARYSFLRRVHRKLGKKFRNLNPIEKMQYVSCKNVTSFTFTPNRLVHLRTSSHCTTPSRRSTFRSDKTLNRSRELKSVTMADSNSPSSPITPRLLIVGPGVLGSFAGTLWLEKYGAGTVVGQTNTTSSHESLKSLGIQPRTKDSATNTKFSHVLFAAPPSGSADYPAEIQAALDLWDGSGAFVFTSSAAVYAVEDGSACDEDSPVIPLGNERTDKLLRSEEAVLNAGGSVVRLVGLYHRNRGAHTFFLRQGLVDRWSGYTVNLIHYEDAASIAVSALAQNKKSEVFIGCDGCPVTFEDMMKAVVESGEFQGNCTFTGAPTHIKGKTMSNPKSRESLHWQPKYPSFVEFMKSGAKDWYLSQEGKSPVGAPHS